MEKGFRYEPTGPLVELTSGTGMRLRKWRAANARVSLFRFMSQSPHCSAPWLTITNASTFKLTSLLRQILRVANVRNLATSYQL